MSLRQTSDGHVLTIQSAEGHMIRLSIQSGRAVLLLSDAVEGSGLGLPTSAQGGVATSPVLEEGIFTPIVSRLASLFVQSLRVCFVQAISCTVDLVLLSCSLSVDEDTSELLQVNHTQPIFFPRIPLQFGRVEDETGERESFVGCIRDLATNGLSAGFR